MSFNPHAVIEKKDRGGGKRTRADRFSLRHPIEVKSVAIVLAGLMIFSVFGANVSSIVKLFTAEAATSLSEYTYYDAGFTLYDYHSNGYSASNPSGYVDDNHRNLNDSSTYPWTRFDAFNSKLYNDSSNYVKDAGGKNGYNTTGHKYSNATGEINNLMPNNDHPTTYFPLYLGWQHDKFSQQVNGEDIRTNNTKYNYSLSANAQACDGESNAAAAQGLVNKELNASGLITQGGEGNVHVLPYFNSSFLTSDIANQITEVDTFRFRYHNSGAYEGYYVYDSREDALVRDTTKKTLSAVDDGDTSIAGYERYNDNKGNPGFFPAGNHNFGFGAIFDINFTMTEDGKTPSGDDMIFNFSGDDDVWVFVDGHLVLDIGGAHGRVTGNINFAKGTNYVSARKKTSAYEYSKAQGKIGTGDIDYRVTEDISDKLNDLGLYSDPTKTHKLKVFYLERGHQESNCMITFNFHQADTLTVSNKIDASGVNAWFRSTALEVAESEAIMYQLVNNGGENTQPAPDDGDSDFSHEIKKINPGSTTEKVTVTFYNPNSAGTGWSDTAWKTKDFAKGHRVLLPTPTREYYEFKGWTRKKYNPTTMKILNEDGTDSTTDFNPATDIVYGGDNGTSNSAILVEDDVLYSYWEVAPVTYTDSNLGRIKNAYGYVFMNTNGLNGTAGNNLNDSETWDGKYIIRNMTKHFNKYPGETLNDTTVFAFQWNGGSSSCEYPTESWFGDHSGLSYNDNQPYHWGWQENYFLIIDTTVNYSYRVILSGSSLVSNDPNYDTLSSMDASIKGYIKELLTLHDKLTSTRSTLISHGEYTGTDAIAAKQLKAAYDTAVSEYNDAIKLKSGSGTNIQHIVALIKSLDSSYTTTTSSTLALPPVIDIDEFPEDPDEGQTTGDEPQTTDPDEGQTTGDQPQTTDPDEGQTTGDEPQTTGDESQTTGDEPQTTGDEPQTTGDEPQTGDPDAPRSGTDAGHWVGSPDGTYRYVAATNYRVKWIGYTDSGVRRTNNSGQFPLAGNQSAKFTVQFVRDSNLKVAPRGGSYLLPKSGQDIGSTANQNGASELSSDNSGHPLSTRYSTTWQIYDNQKTNSDGTPKMSETGKTAVTDGYSPRTAFAQTWTTENKNNPSVSDNGAYSFLMDYVDDKAEDNEFVDVYVDYTNTILTGDIYFKKTVSSSAASAYPNQEYKFKVQVKNIFGGGSDSDPYDTYTGGYTLIKAGNNQEPKTATGGWITLKKDESFLIADVPVDTSYTIEEWIPKALDNDGTDDDIFSVESVSTGSVAMTEKSVTGTIDPAEYASSDNPIKADNGVYRGSLGIAVDRVSGNITVIFEYDPDTANALGLYRHTANGYEYTFTATSSMNYVPYATTSAFNSNYTVKWTSTANPPTDDVLNWYVSENYFDPDLQSDFKYSYTVGDCMHLTTDGNLKSLGKVTGVVLAADRGDTVDGVNNYTPYTNDVVTGPMASYTPYAVKDTDYQIVLTNTITIPVNTLIIKKNIKQNYYSEQDDPAGLLSDTLNRFNNVNNGGVYIPTFGGATGSAIDPNGYQGATGAQQTFIYKITEYNDADFSDATGNVYYETISFNKNDIKTDTPSSGLTKFKAMKVTFGKHYKVQEITDWSWKYDLTSVEVSISSASQTAHDNDDTLPINHKNDSTKICYFSVFDETISPDNDAHSYKNAAMASFENTKWPGTNAKSKVEGDTDYCINSLTHEEEEG